jgi:hypothetical protein
MRPYQLLTLATAILVVTLAMSLETSRNSETCHNPHPTSQSVESLFAPCLYQRQVMNEYRLK